MNIKGRHINTRGFRKNEPKVADFYGQVMMKSELLTIRVDDNNNPAFWLEIVLTKEELVEILSKGKVITT